MSSAHAPLLQETEEKKTSIPSCSLLLANGAIGTYTVSKLLLGAGILTLSLAVSKIGYGLGLIMYVFFGRGLLLYPFPTSVCWTDKWNAVPRPALYAAKDLFWRGASNVWKRCRTIYRYCASSF